MCIGWMTLEGINGCPVNHTTECIGLIGTGNVLLVHSDEDQPRLRPWSNLEPSYFEVTQTRIDIAVSYVLSMDEGLPPSIPFFARPPRSSLKKGRWYRDGRRISVAR